MKTAQNLSAHDRFRLKSVFAAEGRLDATYTAQAVPSTSANTAGLSEGEKKKG
jgi:hypothetical protein